MLYEWNIYALFEFLRPGIFYTLRRHQLKVKCNNLRPMHGAQGCSSNDSLTNALIINPSLQVKHLWKECLCCIKNNENIIHIKQRHVIRVCPTVNIVLNPDRYFIIRKICVRACVLTSDCICLICVSIRVMHFYWINSNQLLSFYSILWFLLGLYIKWWYSVNEIHLVVTNWNPGNIYTSNLAP